MNCRPRRVDLTALCTVLVASASWPLLPGGQLLAQTEEACAGDIVRNVFIDNHSIFDTAEMGEDARFLWAYNLPIASTFGRPRDSSRRSCFLRREIASTH